MIQTPAYFRMCPYGGRHGEIVYPDGSKSDPLPSQEQAHHLVQSEKGQKLDESEATMLTYTINQSDLPRTRHDAIARNLADLFPHLF